MKNFLKKVFIFFLVPVLGCIPLSVPNSAAHDFLLPQGKSLLLFDKNRGDGLWSSSAEDVVTVKNGVVFAKNIGEATVTFTGGSSLGAVDNNAKCLSYRVRVTQPEVLKSASYLNDRGKLILYAITSLEIEDIKVCVGGKDCVSYVTNKVASEGDVFWKIEVSTEGIEDGHFVSEVYLLRNSVWTKSNKTVDGVFLNSKDIEKETTARRSVSNELLQLIMNWEGFCRKIEDDTLVSGVHNIGIGNVINYGESFYNDISREHAFVELLSKINSGCYVKDVNNFLISNKIKCNQHQFDALVSFSYNLGTGWLKESQLKKIILDTVEPGTGQKNLSFVDKERFSNKVMMYHHVLNPRRCILSLLHRRMGELNVFFYGEYDSTGCKRNEYNYAMPACINEQSKKVCAHEL